MQIQIRSEGEKNELYDPFRKKWVAATPEERVRQGFCAYLVEKLGYPAHLIQNECAVNVNGQKQRADTLIYKGGTFVMVVEYKAPDVAINQAVFDQAARYNSVLRVPYVVVTNLRQCYCCKMQPDGTYEFLQTLPKWDDI